MRLFCPQFQEERNRRIMHTSERSRLHQILQDRSDVTADTWYRSIADTGFTSLTTTEVRSRLRELTGRAISLLFSEPLERGEARSIGSALAGMHFLSSETLGKTQEVLSCQFVEGLTADQVAVVQPALAILLAEISAGFFERASDTILQEQEQIRAAHLSERRQVEEALRESESRLAEAQQLAHVGHWHYDWIQDRLFWSDEIHNIFGVTREEFGGTFGDYFRRVHPDDIGLLSEVGDEDFGGSGASLDHRIIRPDGEVRFVQHRLKFVFDEGRTLPDRSAGEPGNGGFDESKAFLEGMLHMLRQRMGGRDLTPVRVVGTMQDITERKRAERELENAYGELEGRVAERTVELGQANEELRAEISKRKRAEETQRFMSETSAVLASSLDYRRTLSDVARLAVPQLADWCAVHIKEDGSLTSVAVAHQDPAKLRWAQELQERYPSDPNAPRGVPQVVRTGRSEFYPEITNEMLSAGAHDPEHLRIMHEVGFTSAIIVPLVARGRTLGAITLISAESERRYGEADLELAEELARRAALAVDNARLYEDARREIAERQRAEEELRESEDRLRQATEAAELGTWDYDPIKGEMSWDERAKAAFGLPPEADVDYEPFLAGLHPEDRQRTDEALQRALNPLGGGEFEAEYRTRGLEDGVERWVAARGRASFEEGKVVRFVGTVLDITERKRLEKSLQEIREAERNRIARDLHDGVLQELAYGLAEAQIVRRLSEDESLSDRLEQLIGALQRTRKGLRDAVYDLRQDFTERSFVRSVESLVELNRQMNAEREVELVAQDGFPRQLPDPMAGELLRVVQEALNNARRHSEARRIQVTMAVEEGGLLVEVADDGRGFDTETVSLGIGFKSMQERSATIAGKLEVTSRIGEGTRVRLHVPRSVLPGGILDISARRKDDGSV
jgi:PAS domain S-box-containing protein